MVFDSGKDKDRTMMGTTPEAAAQVLAAAGADVIGANCGQGIEGFVPICQRLHAATDRPIWIKANAGMPQLVEGRPVYRSHAGVVCGLRAGVAQDRREFPGRVLRDQPGVYPESSKPASRPSDLGRQSTLS